MRVAVDVIRKKHGAIFARAIEMAEEETEMTLDEDGAGVALF